MSKPPKPVDNIPASLDILSKIPHVKKVELVPGHIHPKYQTVRITFAPPNLRVTPRYGGANHLADAKGTIAVYEPPAGMGTWTIDIHVPENPVSIEQLWQEERYGSVDNYGTGADNLCWKLVEISGAKYLNQSIYGAGFTGHIYYEGISAAKGVVNVIRAANVFAAAARGSGSHRQHALAFCIEDRMAQMLRDACLRGDVAAAFAMVYDMAGQTHYKVPRQYSLIKGKNVFYAKPKKAGVFAGVTSV